MDLPSSVVKKFVELTKEPESTTGHYVYGTAIVNGDEKYVQVDGSESLTSVSIATDIATGDRVLLYIENHTASVIGNVTCPASGRGAIDVSDMLQDFETLVVGDLYAITETVETIYANYVSTDYLETYYFTAEYIVGNYLLAASASLTYATIDNLDAEKARITALESSQITTEYLEANYASIIDLDAVRAQIKELDAEYAKIDWVDATFATIEDLLAYEAYIYYLDVDIADIKSLLAGVAGVGELEAIHLTASNVVIEGAIITDAAIAYVSADKITSGTIYTKYVQIADDENKRLWIDGGTIQLIDINNIVRVQIGEDNLGDYNLYLWDDSGTLIWNPKGLTEEGLTGNGAIIKNAAVDDNAAIAGYKLDIDSVASELNSNGTLVVNAAHVKVDDNTLDYTLSQIQTQIQGLEGVTTDGLISWTAYFALGSSDTEPPISNDDVVPALTDVALTDYSFTDIYESDVVPALTDVALTDYSYTDVYEASSTLWTISQPQQEDGLYLWMRYYCTYADGHTEWSTPILLTDSYLRNNVSDLMTQLKVVQGDISAKVWLSDINESISDLWAMVDVSIGDVLIEVGSLIDENTKYLESEIARIDVQSDNISLTVAGIKSSVDNIEENYVTKASLVLQLDENGTATLIEEANYIDLIGNQISITSTNFLLTREGHLESYDGVIGGWTIGKESIYNNIDSLNGTEIGTYIGIDGILQNGNDSNSNYSVLIEDGQIDCSYIHVSNSLYFGSITSPSDLNNYVYFAVGNTYGRGIYAIEIEVNNSLFNKVGDESYFENTFHIGNSSTGDDSNITIRSERTYNNWGESNDNQYTNLRISGGSFTINTYDFDINAYYFSIYTSDRISLSTSTLSVSGAVTLSSTLSVSGAVTLSSTLSVSGAVTLSSTLTTSGNIYAGTTSGTSAIYSYCRSSYGNIALYVATDKSRGLRDITTGSWMIAYNSSNVLYIGNTSYQSLLRGSSISITGAVTISSTLEVSGAVTMSSTLTISGNITCGSSSNTGARNIYCQNSYGNISLRVTSDGQRGIRDLNHDDWLIARSSGDITYLSVNDYPLIIRGSSITLNSESGAAVTSDRKTKDNIEPFAIKELLDKLIPRTYTIKGYSNKKHIGFVVDEVEDAMREAGYNPDDYGITTHYTNEDGEEYGAIRYDEFIPILLYEIQELRNRVNTLEANA